MTRLIRAIEVPAYAVASGLNFAAYVFFMLFTDRSATVYIVAALVFIALLRIALLERRLAAPADVQPRPLNLQAPVSQEALAEFAANLDSSRFNR
jgi:hypothetical protein